MRQVGRFSATGDFSQLRPIGETPLIPPFSAESSRLAATLGGDGQGISEAVA